MASHFWPWLILWPKCICVSTSSTPPAPDRPKFRSISLPPQFSFFLLSFGCLLGFQLLDDLQSSWLLLVVHCAAARANYLTRVVEPGAALEFCQRHDASMWRCFCAFARIEPEQPEDVWDTASMPLALGGLRFWADCMPMIPQRHPQVAEMSGGFGAARASQDSPRTPNAHI